MAKKNNKHNEESRETESSSSAPQPGDKQYASWWQENLERQKMSRRSATKKIAIGSAVGATVLFLVVSSGDEEEYEEVYSKSAEHDALELQRKSGWNVGGTYGVTMTDAVSADSMGGAEWKQMLQPASLLGAYKPASEKLLPYVVPTLVQSLGENTLREAMRPINSPAMQHAYGCGLGMRDILKNSKDPSSTMIVVDMAGPQSVAFTAALSDVAEPLVNFDNWPHSLGRVKSHETLGAMLYYAAEVQANRSKRPEKAPPVVVLDRERLTPLDAGDVTTFDNRYIAKMPTVQNLKDLGIKHILYITPHNHEKQETDDLNEDFALYSEANIDVSLLPLTDFVREAKTADTTASRNATAQAATTAQSPVYYYGGHMHGYAFFYYYAAYSSVRPLPSSYTPPAYTQRTAYTPTRRSTMFTSRSVGSTAMGVGKQRPTGFGRVSTAVDNKGKTWVGRTGSFEGRRSVSGRSASGRSSFGRSGGRGFSS